MHDHSDAHVMGPSLRGVFCPECGNRAGTVVAELGPTLVRHDRKVRTERGTIRCHREWVAVPDGAAVRLIEVDGRASADAMLSYESARFLAMRELRIARAHGQSVEDVFGVRIDGVP